MSRAGGCVAAAAALALVFAGTTPAAPASTRASRPPSTVVAVQPTGLAVLDASDGHVVREAAPSLPYDPVFGASELSVTKDRSAAFVSGANIDALVDCGEDADPEFLDLMSRVDLTTGAVSPLGNGRAPVVTDDGTRIAYVSQRCDAPEKLAVRTLATGRERVWRVPRAWGEWKPVAWAPNGRDLVVERYRATESNIITTVAIVDTRATTDAVKSRGLGPRRHLSAPYELLPLGSGRRWVALVGQPGHHPDRFVEYDLTHQRPGRVLLLLRGFGSLTTPHLLDVDEASHSLLFSFFIGVSPTSLSVWRWTRGDRSPTKIAIETNSARWGVLDNAATKPTPTPPTSTTS